MVYSESIPLTKMPGTPRESVSIDEEEEATLLTHDQPRNSYGTLGAILQVVTFTVVGLLIALASGAFAYYLRGHLTSEDDYIHAPLPDLNPSLLKYFGGMGPYIGGEYVPPPEECKVTQVHMISRHGERYPTRNMGSLIARFAANISGFEFDSELSFLNDWKLEDWLYAPKDQLEQETLTGPAAGSLRMFTLGSEFRARYPDVWSYKNHGSTNIWSSNSTRVIDSAKYFSSAFFGVNTNVTVEVIPETLQQWGNSLTTSSSCLAFQKGKFNATYGYLLAAQTYQRTFLPKITKRLSKLSNYKFTDHDVLAMSYICPFQVNALGSSPFCNIFTKREWMDFNYARDLATYYGSGYSPIYTFV
jgi:acid phosphatase